MSGRVPQLQSVDPYRFYKAVINKPFDEHFHVHPDAYVLTVSKRNALRYE